MLRLFIYEHERTSEKAEALRQVALGFHHEMLTAIAADTTSIGTSATSEVQAKAAINKVEVQLMADGQITYAPQPIAVLDVLVSHHTLVRSGPENNGLSFQHQQIQEWYASFRVQGLMLAAAEGDQEAMNKLRVDVLNMPAWEEAILFACERLSRSDQNGLQAVAAAILETIGIDPMLVAEMIYRSSPGVWDEIKDKIIAFVGRWHVAGKVDRAVRFMISTGHSEFAPQIWPLISDPDMQVRLAVLRAGRQFRPSVIGADVEGSIAKLPEEVRKDTLSSFAFDGDMDGIELATRLAQSDPNPEIQFSVIEGLLFRRANRYVVEILQKAPDEVWHKLAQKGYAEEIADSETSARLQREFQHYLESQPDSLSKLRVLLYSGRPGGNLGREVGRFIEEAVDSPDLGTIYDAHKYYPDEVTMALKHRLEAGRGIPFQAEDLLQAAGITIDAGPIVELVIQAGSLEGVAKAAVSIVGQNTVGKLIDSLVPIDLKLKAEGGRADDPTRQEYYRLIDWISKTNLTSFIQTVLSRSETDDPIRIALLAELIVRHGKEVEQTPLQLDGELRKQVIAAVGRWAEILLGSPVSTRAQLAEVALAIGRLDAPELLPLLQQMLVEDLKRWRQARDEFFAARDRGLKIPVPPDVSHSWTFQYRRAFAAIGGDDVVELMKAYLPDPDFGIDAAWILKAIWERQQDSQKDSGWTPRPDFSEVKTRRNERQGHSSGKDSSPFADAIIVVVERLIKPGSSLKDHSHALQLAKIAFSMPYGDKAATINALLELPQQLRVKPELLAVLVNAGEIISADIILDGLNTLLEEAKTNPWLVDERSGELEGWLELLPFSDRPNATLDALEMLDPNLKQPWRSRRLLSALGHAPSPEAEHVLNLLPKMDAGFLSQYEWLAALEKRGSVSAAHIFLELVCEGAFENKPGGIDSWALSRIIVAAIKANTDFRAEVYRRYESFPTGPGYEILERAISEAIDVEGLLLLIRGKALQGKLFYCGELVRHFAVDRRPSAAWEGATEVYSVPVPELRRRLFAMIGDDTPEAKYAATCLNAIDELRDEYGPAESEPRHPDIDSGRPWPLEAGQA